MNLPLKGPNTALDRWVPLGLVLYFGLHLISRVLVSPSLELDEAEQLLHMQALSLGYGFQPPLYTWLQALVFAFTGPGVFGLALLKAVLLWLTWWAMYKLARLFYEAKDALAIGLSLALFPQFLWESQRDLTHTVLLVACVALAWLVILNWQAKGMRSSPKIEAKQQVSAPPWGVTALLGLLVGAAIVAKYSAGLWLVILIFSIALAGGPLRHWLAPRPFAFVALVAFMVVLPHGLWLLNNLSEVVAPIQAKLGMEGASAASVTSSPKYGTALVSLLQALGGFTGLWVLITTLALGWHWLGQKARVGDKTEEPVTSNESATAQGLQTSREETASSAADVPSYTANPGGSQTLPLFWKTYLLLFLAVLLAMIVFADATEFKDRWMQPFLVILPLAFAQLAFKNELPPAVRRAWTASAITLMLLALVLMPLRTVLGTQTGELSRLAIPYEELAQALKQDHPGVQGIVAPQGLVAGNLALYSKAHNWKVSLQGKEVEAGLWVLQVTPSRGAFEPPPEGWVERATYTFPLRYNQTVKGLSQAVWRVYGPPNAR
jgi:4-amino-4-deoxy-L-arabinose transferase-like glycosyltransferase